MAANKSRKQVAIVITTTAFFLRRLLLCATLVFWQEFFWGQVAIQMQTSIFMIIIYQWTKPFESNFATNMETFNEMTTLILLTLLFLFSDFVAAPEDRSMIGMTFIIIMCVYMAVHLFFMLWDIMCDKCRLRIKRCYVRCKHKRTAEQPTTKKAKIDV